MRTHLLSRDSIKQFSPFSCAFTQQTRFQNLLHRPFDSYQDLFAQLEEKKKTYSVEKRQLLVSEFKKQIGDYASKDQLANLELLANKNTFTVTTGHQLTLFAGPLYFIYKALHVAKLAKEFNAKANDAKLVPVFWLATEDHDIEEVRSTQLFGKKLTWSTEQTGAVGQMQMSDFNEVYQEFKAFFKGKETDITRLMEISNSGTYQDFSQRFVSELFAELGILVLQPNTKAFKSLFVPIMLDEIKFGKAINAVELTNKSIEKLGFKPQADAREINIFYLGDGTRKRIEKTETGFKAGDRLFSSEELEQALYEDPTRFSPNVILRPVYQETILPNLAYVGGGGEMAYWIQLKGVFETYNTLFPLIQQRVSLHLLDSSMQKRMDKLPFDWKAYFGDKNQLKQQFLNDENSDELDFSEIISIFTSFKEKFIEKARSLDPQLTSMVEAEFARISKQRESLEQRLIKTVKQRHESSLNAIDFVSDRFLPENQLQERYFHWLNFVPSGDFPTFFSELLDLIQPFEPDLIVVEL